MTKLCNKIAKTKMEYIKKKNLNINKTYKSTSLTQK